MRILTTMGSGVRHAAVAATEAALVVAIGVALVFSTAVVTGGKPAGAGDAFAKGPRVGAAASSVSLNQDPSTLHLGSSVTFTSSASGLTGNQYPMIVVSCSQNGAPVYVQLDHADATFLLGGGSSQWLLNGGAASCKATLYAYGGKSIVTLAGPTTFDAAG
jgi:hypothetical protein